MHSKPTLSFSKNGTFRVLMLSDTQEKVPFDQQTQIRLERLLDHARPDLVLLGGDNVMGPEIHSAEELEEVIDTLAQLLERRQLPWAHVFGNHDHDVKLLSEQEHQALYERYPHCVSGHTQGIHGITNFTIPIYGHNSDQVVFQIWGLDTNNLVQGSEMDGLVVSGDFRKESVLPNMPVSSDVYEIVWFDQLMWLWNTSMEQERLRGRKTPGLLCMHRPPMEIHMLMDNQAQCGVTGGAEEAVSQPILNSGLFSMLLQRGEVQCICAGHTHMNTLHGTYCGVQLCFDGAAGCTCYGLESERGGRLFEISQEDPWNIQTRMLRYCEIEGK